MKEAVLNAERLTPFSELIAYPTGAFSFLLRLPTVLYRFGLGGLMRFLPMLILTTRGHRSGLVRHTPLEYRQHGNKIYLMSYWGARANWVQNLLAAPKATIQQGGQTFAATARLVDSDGEALRVLHLFRRRAPFVYDPVIARLSGERSLDVKILPDISGEFTIVRLDRLPNERLPLPPVRADLAWALPTSIVVSVFMLVFIVFTRSRRS
jgi:deazaflavin-dependent oxidoreductase (nitroreductase family)